MKKILNKILNQCPTCKGLFGTHNRLIHLIKLRDYVRQIKTETPWMWESRINFKGFQEEVKKYSL